MSYRLLFQLLAQRKGHACSSEDIALKAREGVTCMMKVLYSSTQSMPKWFILKALEKRMYQFFLPKLFEMKSMNRSREASDVEDGQEEDKNANVSPCEEDEDNEVNGNSDPSSAGSAPYSFSFEDDAPGVESPIPSRDSPFVPGTSQQQDLVTPDLQGDLQRIQKKLEIFHNAEKLDLVLNTASPMILLGYPGRLTLLQLCLNHFKSLMRILKKRSC